MKIAIAADTASTDASISMQAARAPCYLVFDEDGMLLDTIMNPYNAAEHGVAPRIAHLLQEQQINTLVAGEFGERFIELLQENNISAVIAQGTVSNAIKTAIS